MLAKRLRGRRRAWVHPEKERLRTWYTRLGYRVVRSAPFERVAAHLASRLAVPCEFLIFRKHDLQTC